MVRLAIIGTGGMANHHAREFLKFKGVRLVACCDIDRARAEAFAKTHSIPSVHTDYRQLLERETLDAVANITPDAVHAEVALAALEAGLHILSEKPMATSQAEARAMLAAARRAGVIHMINFSYRNSCALQRVAALVQAGGIGRVLHVEASYLQSWLVSRSWGDWRTNPALTWRLSTRHGSAGDLGDIGCHIYDLTTLVCGDIAEIACRLKTFDKGVPRNRLGPYVLDANDSFVANVQFANGALGTIHSSRWACGQANSLRLRAYGDAGAVELDLDRSYSEYRVCTGQKSIDAFAWKTVTCKPTPNMQARFLRAIRTGEPDPSDFGNGAKIQACLAASFESDRQNRPVKVRV